MREYRGLRVRLSCTIHNAHFAGHLQFFAKRRNLREETWYDSTCYCFQSCKDTFCNGGEYGIQSLHVLHGMYLLRAQGAFCVPNTSPTRVFVVPFPAIVSV